MSEQTYPIQQLIAVYSVLTKLEALKQAPIANLRIAQNIRALEGVLGDYEKARKKIFESIADGDMEIKEDDPRKLEFEKQMKPLDTQEVEFTPVMLTVDELNLKENLIRPAHLSVLSIILSDFL